MLILSLWAKQPGKFFNISTKTGGGKWKDNFFAPDEFGRIPQFLRDHDDCEIYFCPHGFNRRSRTKDESVEGYIGYADLDFSDPRDLPEKIKPTIAFESSPGRFVGLWISKDIVPESVNRRLTYFTNADKGGWALTKVLRVPGTRNYKYKEQPKVRILWDDGPTYTTKKLDNILPAEEVIDDGDVIDPAQVMKKYQTKLQSWVRRELINTKFTRGVDRSEMLWKLENACIEAGMTQNEAFAVIKRSIWNKFAGRRNEDAQLKRELDKVYDQQFSQRPKKGAEKRHLKEEDDEEENTSRFKFIPMSQVKAENLDFLWHPYLVKGELSILEGDPGLGKSYLAQMVSAHIATGKPLPTHKKGVDTAKPGVVVYFDIENSAGSVTRVRLRDNGYNKLENYIQEETAFSIDDDDAMDELYEGLEQIKPTLMVFDTLNTFIGRADTYKASEATQALDNFKALAKHFNCAVLVIRHLTKGSGSAMYRGQGSIAFSGGARVVMSCGVDPDDPETRAMAVTKINFAKPPPAMTFRIDETREGRSKFVWGEFVSLSSQQIMDAASTARSEGTTSQSLQEAMEFIEKELAGGPLEENKLIRMAEKRSIPKKMLFRAGEKLHVLIKKVTVGAGKENRWSLRKSR